MTDTPHTPDAQLAYYAGLEAHDLARQIGAEVGTQGDRHLTIAAFIENSRRMLALSDSLTGFLKAHGIAAQFDTGSLVGNDYHITLRIPPEQLERADTLVQNLVTEGITGLTPAQTEQAQEAGYPPQMSEAHEMRRVMTQMQEDRKTPSKGEIAERLKRARDRSSKPESDTPGGHAL